MYPKMSQVNTKFFAGSACSIVLYRHSQSGVAVHDCHGQLSTLSNYWKCLFTITLPPPIKFWPPLVCVRAWSGPLWFLGAPYSCSRNYEHFDTPLIRNIAKYEWNVSQCTALSASEHNRRTQLPGTTKVHSNKTSYYYRNQLKTDIRHTTKPHERWWAWPHCDQARSQTTPIGERLKILGGGQ